MRALLLLLSLILTVLCHAQVLTIDVAENHFGIDEDRSLIVSRADSIFSIKDIGHSEEVKINFGERGFSFDSVPDHIDYSSSYNISSIDSGKQYTLYFTELPLVQIESSNEIVDEPKRQAHFAYFDDEQTVVSKIGIELRGGVSQYYPKKTYDIEFWEDETGDETLDMQFGDLREDDDWILDALYNEPLRIRSFAATKLWLEMHEPYYSEEEPEAKSGADVMYVELFLNGQYNGLYNLSEQADRKQLKLKKYKDKMRGELYKGADWGASTLFDTLLTFDNNSRKWGGHEFEYPDEDQITDWGNLHRFTDFVINSSESEFADQIWSQFEKSNFIDYFLFLNLIRATDNTGKNIYIAKYTTDEPYFYVPWDLDGCFGNFWNGQNDPLTNDILSNDFMERVIEEDPGDILSNMANKWFEYRENLFSFDSLSNTFSDLYVSFQENKIYERESIVYPNYSFENLDLSYTLDWIEDRLSYLDDYFGNVVSVSSQHPERTIVIYPNPANDQIFFRSSLNLEQESFKVYNDLGQEILSGIIVDNSISLEKLRPGLYFLSMAGYSQKLIKN